MGLRLLRPVLAVGKVGPVTDQHQACAAPDYPGAGVSGSSSARRTIFAVLLSKITPLRLGLVFSAFSLGAVVLASVSNWLKDWMPNVATELGSLALTIVVVDSVVGFQTRRRIKPRLDAVFSDITGDFRRLVEAVAIDYIETHVESFKTIPRDMRAILQQWEDEYDAADTPRIRIDGEPGFLLRIARLTGQSLRKIRAANVDILNELEPTLVVAIDDLVGDIENYSFFYNFFRQSGKEDDQRSQRGHLRSLVDAIQSFAAVYVAVPGAAAELADSEMRLLEEVRISTQNRESG